MSAPEVREDDARTFHRVLFGQHTWPEGTHLALTGPPIKWGAVYCEVGDEDAFVGLVERTFRWTDAYVRMTPVVEEQTRSTKPGRGPASVGVALRSVWADVDTADGLHKKDSKRHPDYSEAGRLARTVAEPSLAVATGGGVHAHFLLNEPLPIYNGGDRIQSASADLLDRWASRIERPFREAGCEFDQGVQRDSNRVLRIPGSTAHYKYAEKGLPDRGTRLLFARPEVTYSLAEIDALCPRPARDAPTRRQVSKARSTAVAQVGGPVAKRVKQTVPLERLLEEVWEMEQVGGDRWVYPRSDGTIGDDTHAQTWTLHEFGYDVVTAYGARLQDAWGQDGEGHSLNAWTLICHAVGSPELARTACEQLLPDVDALVEFVADCIERRGLRAA